MPAWKARAFMETRRKREDIEIMQKENNISTLMAKRRKKSRANSRFWNC
ncbi:hypothetical protein [Faecalibaculum rodentium]